MQMGTTTPTKPSQRRRDELRASLNILAEVCPVEGCNPEDCPLYEFRKLKHAARLNWFNALAEDDLAYISAYHHVCLNLKMLQELGDKNASTC
jgi:hypothetical protein